MKERLRELLRGKGPGPAARNLAREFLQAQVLAALQRAGAMVPLAFQGARPCASSIPFGGIRRISSLPRAARDRLRPARLPGSGPGGPAPGRIRLRPGAGQRPAGGPQRLRTLSRAAPRSGAFRPPRGRDFYDLVWYLSDPAWREPNLVLLNNALAQTGWTSAPLSQDSWVDAVRARLRSVRWDVLTSDVRPLLASAEDRALLTRDTVVSLLDQRARPPSRRPPRQGGRRSGRRR